MRYNMIEWAQAIKSKVHSTAFPLMTYPGLPLINKTITEMVTSGEIQFRCIEALVERFPLMPATPMSMDLSLEAEAFGSKVIFADHSVPTISERVIHNNQDIETLQLPEPNTPQLKEFIKAAQLTVDANFGKPVFTGCIGPYSLAGRLMDITEIMTGILMYSEEIHLLLQKTTQFIINYLNELKKTGVNGVVIAEPASGLLAAEECDEFSSKYIKQIVDEVQTDYFMVMLHNCGNTETLVDSMVSTGAMAFHFGNAVEMQNILPQIPTDRLALGNIDPANTIKTGTPESIKAGINLLREKTKAFSNFILSSGCDIPPGTPFENIDAFFQPF